MSFTLKLRFESSVISYGSKTVNTRNVYRNGFESSVISYGSKTHGKEETEGCVFESSVISYGSKTKFIRKRRI